MTLTPDTLARWIALAGKLRPQGVASQEAHRAIVRELHTARVEALRSEPTIPVTRTTLERWRRAVVACATGDSDQTLDDMADVAAEIKSVLEET